MVEFALQEQLAIPAPVLQAGVARIAMYNTGNQNVLKEVAVRDLARELKEGNGDANGVIFDGVVTQRILDIAAEKGLEYLIGAKMGNIAKSPSCVKVLTKEA